MSFSNLYYKRTAATAKACFVCYKPTVTVLATINAIDFIYTCPGHLADPGFASPVGESGDNAAGARKVGLSAEEIAKVKEEWEERQKEKKQMAEEKKRAEGEKTKEVDKKEVNKDDKKSDSKSSATPRSWTPSPAPTPTMPKHERYTLHRDFFAMRLAEHRKRKQNNQAKELAPRLPGAPTDKII